MLTVKNLSVHYGKKQVVKNISFSVDKAESLGIIGESGSGKTTIARAITRLIPKSAISPDSSIIFNCQELSRLNASELKAVRKEIQIVFQDPFSSFNPRIKVGRAIQEGLEIHKIGSVHEREEQVMNILSQVGLNKDSYDKYPHEFSGGQRQRLALARSLVLKPSFIIADEPVSALDVSVQAQILNLMLELKQQYQLTYILIAHDLGIVDYFCDRVLVIYQGELMEYGPKTVLRKPFHPYTNLLLESLPGTPAANTREDLPSVNEVSACPFFVRCPSRSDNCSAYTGQYHAIGENHLTSCVRRAS